MGDYDRTRALFDGRVQIDGVDPVYMLLNPEEMFFRAMRSVDFDITELSFSSYLVKHSRGECPYIALPVFLSRAFRHTSIYVRKDRIREPADLKGKRIGLPEYQLTANVWARAILQDDFGYGAVGVGPEDLAPPPLAALEVQHRDVADVRQPGRAKKALSALSRSIFATS